MLVVKIKTWIGALRLRTLPLAVSGILMGSALAELSGYTQQLSITYLAIATAVCLQILSNLANDYGDFTKGTDNANRLGNQRALQSGNLSVGTIFFSMVIFGLLSLGLGLLLLWIASEKTLTIGFVCFLILGLLAIAAAIKYTVGKKAYGYSGFGDVFVFVFFGPVAVVGVYLLQHHFVFYSINNWWVCAPAIAMGLLSTAVLNTNNIRDVTNDAQSGKNTLVVKMGVAAAKKYHWFLVITALVLFVIFLLVNHIHWIQFLSLLGFLPILLQAKNVYTTEPSAAYNNYLKQLSLGILLFTVIYIIVQTIALGVNAINTFNQLNQ